MVSGGAQSRSDVTELVTHMICASRNYNDDEVRMHLDLYSHIIPVTEQWVVHSAKLGRLASTKSHDPTNNKLFAGMVASLINIPLDDRKTLYAIITYLGGHISRHFTNRTTHLICGYAAGGAYQKALSLKLTLKIVTPDYIQDCVKRNEILMHEIYHPRLLKAEKPKLVMKMQTQPSGPQKNLSNIIGFEENKQIILQTSQSGQQLFKTMSASGGSNIIITTLSNNKHQQQQTTAQQQQSQGQNKHPIIFAMPPVPQHSQNQGQQNPPQSQSPQHTSNSPIILQQKIISPSSGNGEQNQNQQIINIQLQQRNIKSPSPQQSNIRSPSHQQQQQHQQILMQSLRNVQSNQVQSQQQQQLGQQFNQQLQIQQQSSMTQGQSQMVQQQRTIQLNQQQQQQSVQQGSNHPTPSSTPQPQYPMQSRTPQPQTPRTPQGQQVSYLWILFWEVCFCATFARIEIRL